MLTDLYIENIAVIERTNISFGNGLNVMTGETGAGKSVIVGAINSILGRRVSKEMIRTGEEKAFVSACFENVSKATEEKLHELGYKLEEDGLLIIQRELNSNGKNSCRVNNRPASLSVLKEIGKYLVNIYGQHESYDLLLPQTHISYIDKFGKLEKDINIYRDIYREMKRVKDELDLLISDDSEKERRIDVLKYQIEEIESMNLTEEEFDDLVSRRNKYMNSEKISNAVNRAKYLIDGADEFFGCLGILQDACSAIDEIEDCFPAILEIRNRLQTSSYDIEDCSFELGKLLEDIEYDPIELSSIEERLDSIYKLRRKYGDTVEDILKYLDKAKIELDSIKYSEEKLIDLQNRYNQLHDNAMSLAKDLSFKRKNIGDVFIKKVKEELKFLDMPGVKVGVNREECELYDMGNDKIEFLISTNSGEPMKPIAKVASGGELSRIMLAIKNVLSNSEDIDTLIFDEVDTGISGSAAQKVGLKLKQVSNNRQVLCITHLAQIAALGDEHFLIKKEVVDGRTCTNITKLEQKTREMEIARIIGGLDITDTTLMNAREMLERAKVKDLF